MAHTVEPVRSRASLFPCPAFAYAAAAAAAATAGAAQFASGGKVKDTWAEEFREGGCCEGFFLNNADEYNDECSESVAKVNAYVCGTLLNADRVGNMPVLKVQR